MPDPANPQSFNRYSWVLGNPLKFVDPTGHKEQGACDLDAEECLDDELYESYQWYCSENPGSEYCQPSMTYGEAFLTFVGTVAGAELLWGGTIYLIEIGGDALLFRIGKAAVEEFLESQMTGRPFDWANVGLDATTQVLDEAYTAAKYSGRPPVLHDGAQGKHIPGHNNYLPGRSILTYPEPQGLLNDRAGTGQPLRGAYGQPGFKERVDFGVEIGLWVDLSTGMEYPTTVGIIHYSSRGAHIVPARP